MSSLLPSSVSGAREETTGRETAPDKPLREATPQEIQLELIRRWSYNAFDGERVAGSLLQHRSLWEAVLMDRLGIPERRPGELAAMSLIKLRDLPYGYWNVDTLFILCRNEAAARDLAGIIESEDWGGEVQVHADRDEVDRALGAGGESWALVTVWWD